MEMVLEDGYEKLDNGIRAAIGDQKSRDSIFVWRDELDSYYQRMHAFPELDPSEIFRELAAFSARASEIRSYCVRMGSRASTTFRTQEVDYFLSEVDRQFRSWSRVVTVRGQEIALTGSL